MRQVAKYWLFSSQGKLGIKENKMKSEPPPSSTLSPFPGGLLELLRNMEKAAEGDGVTAD